MQLFAALNPHCKRLSIALPARSHAVVDRGRHDENTARHVDEQCRRCRTASSTSAADCTDECRRAWVQTLSGSSHSASDRIALACQFHSIPPHSISISKFPWRPSTDHCSWCCRLMPAVSGHYPPTGRPTLLSIVRLGFAVSLGANAITAITDVYYGAPPPCTKPHCTPYVCPSVRPLFWPGL